MTPTLALLRIDRATARAEAQLREKDSDQKRILEELIRKIREIVSDVSN